MHELLHEGGLFDELVEKKKALFKILNLSLPTSEQIFEQYKEPEDSDELMDIEGTVAGTVDSDMTASLIPSKSSGAPLIVTEKRAKF